MTERNEVIAHTSGDQHYLLSYHDTESGRHDALSALDRWFHQHGMTFDINDMDEMGNQIYAELVASRFTLPKV